MSIQYKELLNDEQYYPVVDTEGAVLVLAGAGTGKTRVLSYRIAYLLEEKQVDPRSILAITFTNNAANTMKERVRDLTRLGSDVWISTFHKLCLTILQYESHHLDSYKRGFSIFDEKDSVRIINKVLRENDFDNSEKKESKTFLWHISNAKNFNLSPEQYKEKISADIRIEADKKLVDEIYLVYKKYQEALIENNAMDFDDLLCVCLNLLTNNKSVREKYQNKFKYILIDEYQDTNYTQNQLAIILASKHKNIFVVGDDDQSIYGWRGSDIGNILEFEKSFPNAKEYKLERNYRSTQSILDCANNVILNNENRKKKKLWTSMKGGVPVEYMTLRNDLDEVDYVFSQINSLIHNHNYKYSDFAILYRVNYLSRRYEDKILQYNYPYVMYGGFKFYEREEVKNACRFLTLIVNPSNEQNLLEIINIPSRKIGQTTKDRLIKFQKEKNIPLINAIELIDECTTIPKATKDRISEFFQVYRQLSDNYEEMPFDRFINAFIDTSKLSDQYPPGVDDEGIDRYQNLVELMNALMEFKGENPSLGLESFLNEVALRSDSDQFVDANKITLSTIHGVKGMEFRCVFLIALEEEIFPNKRSLYEDNEVSEERRLMYVAITRAKERLYMTNAYYRYSFGTSTYNLESRFIGESMLQSRDSIKQSKHNSNSSDDLPSNNYVVTKAALNILQSQVKNVKNKDVKMFKVGDKVIHTRFGSGKILSIEGENAEVEFEKLGRKLLCLRLAPIEVVE